MDERASPDEAFLDGVMDFALRRLGEGESVLVEDVLTDRFELRSQVEEVLALAREVAIVRPRRYPSIAGFEICGELGRGAMGTVFLARQVSLDRQIALKVLPPASALSWRLRRRFRAEARALGRLRHPNIVPVYEVIDSDEVSAYAMEWVEGRTLADILAHLERPGTPRTVDEIEHFLHAYETTGETDYVHYICRRIAKIAHALELVHASELLHRDVKPSNILIRRDGTPLLSDFGLVRGESDELHTQTGQFIGTPAYSAPEQLEGRHDLVDARTDVYSLGVTLFQALSLELPFGKHSTAKLLKRIEEGFARRIEQAVPGLPRDLATIVGKAIEPEPERRYQSAGALADDLERFLERRPILARPQSSLYRFRKLVARHRAVFLALAVFVTLTVGFSVYTTLQARRILRLTDLTSVRHLAEEENELWPAHPDRIDAYRTWLADAKGYALRKSDHEDALARIRAGGELLAGGGLRFDSKSDQFQHEMLEELVRELERFTAPEVGLIAGIEARLAAAITIAERSVDGEDADERWDEAVRSIADREECPAYDGLSLAPQMGLLPLGRDAASGLWEFCHLLSGEAPPAGPDALTHTLDEASGVVFVLIPGGSFRMGGQRRNPNARNHDPFGDHGPVHEVTLAPFFLSKYEMTQGQWLAFTGENPAQFGPRTKLGPLKNTLLHPVEEVSWTECADVLRKLGLELPTEAQWEYAARAGTDTVWWTGSERADLRGAANLADRSAGRVGNNWPEIDDWPELDDGFPVHAPVDALRANPFGLFNVHGNVWEWCRDVKGSYRDPVRPQDGLRIVDENGYRMYRGGSYHYAAWQARSALRYNHKMGARQKDIGLRPARRIDP